MEENEDLQVHGEDEHKRTESVNEYDYNKPGVQLFCADSLRCSAGGSGRRKVVIGVDEAGRGPVLGPMVYGCAFWDISLNQRDGNEHMSQYDDSKQLKESKRDELFRMMEGDDRVGFALRIHSAQELSNKMLNGNGKVNLNVISHDAAIDLIRSVMDQKNEDTGELCFDVVEVYLDTVGDPGKYRAKLETFFAGKGIKKFTVTSKADSLFKVVSAASIAAKVTRDRILREWQFDEAVSETNDNNRNDSKAESTSKSVLFTSVPVGSGYPGDEVTKSWLQRVIDPVFGFPSLVRFSWQTCQTILEEKAIKLIWPCEIEDDGDSDKNNNKWRDKAKSNNARKKLKTEFGSRPGLADEEEDEDAKAARLILSRHGYFRSRSMMRMNMY